MQRRNRNISRRQQIINASINRSLRFSERRMGFIEGARWSDENPDRNNVYTKKELREMGFSFTPDNEIIPPEKPCEDA